MLLPTLLVFNYSCNKSKYKIQTSGGDTSACFIIKSSMKIKFIFLALIFLSAGAYCQSKNTLSILYGPAGNAIIAPAGIDGKGATLYGFNYQRNLTRSFSIETGLEYSINNVLWDYEDAYNPHFVPQKGNVRMLSVPVYANFSFFKYLFADVGFIADFETNYHSNALVDNQSGIGLGLGIGGKYSFNRMTIFVNPFLQLHSAISFYSESHDSLSDAGVKFGVGYKF
jgi:hypothetical protein